MVIKNRYGIICAKQGHFIQIVINLKVFNVTVKFLKCGIFLSGGCSRLATGS